MLTGGFSVAPLEKYAKIFEKQATDEEFSQATFLQMIIGEDNMLTPATLTPIAFILVSAVLGFGLDFYITRKIKNKISSPPGKETKYNKFWHTQFKLLLPLAAIILVAPTLPVPPEKLAVVRRALGILFICTATWLALSSVFLGRFFILARYDISVSDNLDARTVHTQVNVLVKILTIIIVILASTSVIMMFDSIRQFGASILASAGVLGIVIGFAAQRSIATLLAGLQIALTQPIRIDDVVIVEGEWGQIEEITLTYIVVRIWDLRRLVVPTNYFLEKPFQNWTRTSAELLANATIHLDYTIPVEEVRNELHKILKASQYWDGKVWKLHVTNATNQTVELRALMSAANSSHAWELRCEVREKLLSFLQASHADKLPKIRAEMLTEPAGQT